MKNKMVASVLYEIADLLDIKGDVFFKTRAYRIAAQTIEVLDEDVEKLVKDDRLKEISGIGDALAKKITELVLTGKLDYFEKLKKEIPEGLLDMLEIPGLGPKKVSALFNILEIKDIDQLRNACEKGKLRDLDGFGEITERNILRGIKMKEKTSGRVLLNIALENGEQYYNYMKECKDVIRISIAGSLRRKKETIGDLDLLVSSKKPEEVMDFFTDYSEVSQVLLKGVTKTSVVLNDNIQVDLRVVEDKSFGAALQYFTGSKEHNVKMRGLAIKKGFKLNEYGIFEKDTERFISGKDESEIYKTLGLDFIEPELRENRGEIEAAANNKLPSLIKLDDIKGELHVHSNYSDGFEKIQDIAKTCSEMGYEYVGIADHSQSLKVARGLSENALLKKKKEIEKVNDKNPKIKVLFGTECDIKPDGSLDYPDKILSSFDYVGLGIHMSFKMTPEQATQRICRAIENEYVTFLAHPTCRLIGRREPLPFDVEKVIDKAVETNTLLEINSFPDRLDLNDIYVKIAKEKKAKFLISTDSHYMNHLSYMRYGVYVARRGWLEKKDVINTKSFTELMKYLK